MPTPHTAKRGLIRTVPLINSTALVTCLRCVAWIDQQHANTNHPRFVGDVAAKLEERPVTMFGALRFPNRFLSARANMSQLFQGTGALSAFGVRNKLLGNNVVGIRLKAALFAADRAQSAFCAFRADRLQTISPPLVALADSLDGDATVLITVAVRREIGDSKVNPQCGINLIGGWLIHVARHKEVEHPTAQDQIAFTLAGAQQLALAITARERHGLAVFLRHRPDTDRFRAKVEGQDSVIVGDAAVRPICALQPSIQLITVPNLRQAANHHLGRQAVCSLNPLIDQLLEVVLPKYLVLPRHTADVSAGGVGHFKRARQCCGLLGSRLQFNLGNNFHILKCSADVLLCQWWVRLLELVVSAHHSSGRTSAPKGELL